MSVYVALQWFEDGDIPIVNLYEDIGFAADRILYGWQEDSGFTEEDIEAFRRDLLSFKEIRVSQYESACILHMDVVKEPPR